MNAAVAAFAKQSFLVTGYYARRLRSDSFPGVAILCYHGVTGDGPADPRMNFMNLHVRADDLEAWTGRPVRAFAYPNGESATDYTPETVKLVEESGFDFGFTTRPGFATPYEPALEHSRFVMLRGVSAAELGHRLAHSWRH